MSRSLPVLAALLFTSGAVAAQDSIRTAVTTWGASEGLSQTSVRALVQDSSGVLWVGTQGGLNRFDGLEFRLIQSDENGGGLSDDFIQAMAPAPGGRIWIGSYQGGLDLFDPTTETTEQYPFTELGPWRRDATPSGPVRLARSVAELAVLGSGAVLALTDVGLAYLAEGAPRPPPTLVAAPGPAQDSLTALAPCPDGGALVGGSGGQVDRMASDGTWEASLPEVDSIVQALSCGSSILAGTAGGAVLLLDSLGGKWTQVGRIPQPAAFDLKIRRILLADGQLLVGTTEGLFRVELDGGTGIPFRTGGPGEIPDGTVEVLQKDRHGALWIGTWTGLARRHPVADHVQRLRSEESLSGTPVIGIEERGDTSILVGLSPGGVREVFWGSGEPTVQAPFALAPLQESKVYGFAAAPEGGFWIAAFLSGVWRWNPSGSIRRVPLIDQAGAPAPRSYTRMVLVDHRGDVWATVDPVGLMRFDPDSDAFRPHLSTELGGTFVWAMAEDRSGRLWVGAYGGGLARVGVDRVLERVYTVDDDGLPSDRIMSIFIDTDNRLWIGTEGDGLVRFDPADEAFSTITTREGLPSDLVQSVIEDASGDIWISTGAGLARFTPGTGRMRVVRRSAGLAGDQFLANSALTLPDGSLVFGGLQGLSVIDPAAVREYEQSLSPPSVALTGFSIQGRDTTLAPTARPGGLRLEHDENFFAFRFTADDYSDPSHNRYKYRLTPLQEDWVQAGNEPFANYTSVPPGRYTFEIQAANGFGMWNEATFALPVTVVPAYWQTTWFRGLVVLAVLGLVAGFFTYRYRQLEERTHLRLAIAGKLHDDIGADLSSIALKTELVRSNAGLGDKPDRLLADAGRLARDTAQKVRETVWMVNTQYDTLSGLVGKMRDTADTMLAGHVPHDFNAPKGLGDRPITMEFRQNVHLLYKEALNNARKYSGAPRIRIDVEVHGRELTFRVVDDGVGFDPDAVASGNGQRLMRERAKEARGRVSVVSAPGEGTTVEFTGRIH